MEPFAQPHPTALPPGMRVGPWRVQGRRGQGTYGTVYRVARAEASDDKPFALKLARNPEDPRFEREAEVLSRIQHPNVPRLHDRGWWTGLEGLAFPYFVMDWVEGVPLYDWARAHAPSSRQVLRVLAQAARALEATEAAGCVHRDVKGDNVLVDARGRAVLVDFGSGSYTGARPLTRETLPPGTPPYRSPQALRFEWRFRRHRSARYQAGPADDVYALGVTAYRLCTGRYPTAAMDPSASGAEELLTGEPLVPPGALATVSPELEALILRMLTDSPEARGTAAELATALETAAESAGREADAPVVPHSPAGPTVRPVRPKLRRRYGVALVASWLVAAAVGAVLAAATGWKVRPPLAVPQATEGSATGLADAALSAPTAAASVLPVDAQAGVGLDMPKRPIPGQRRPPCPPPQVELHGGCWFEVARGKPPCGDSAYDWKGACFSPVPAPQRPTTSGAP